MRLLIAVTGTPGSGKSVFAKQLGKRLRHCSIIEINDVVKRHRLYSKRDSLGTMIVDLGRLNRKISEILRKRRGINVLVGHLAPELRLRFDIAVVTRCNLKELTARLEMRRYPKEMMVENIASEAVDYCGARIMGKCKECYEAESSADKKRLIEYIVSVAKGTSARKPPIKHIDELHGLVELVKLGNKYGL